MPGTSNGQRVLAQQIRITWADENGTLAGDSMFQIDTFQWRYNPDIVRYWPSGASSQKRQEVNGMFEVTIGGGQTDVGFAKVIADRFSQVQKGNKPSSLNMTRTGYTNTVDIDDGKGTTLFKQQFKSGVITSGSGDQGDGNRPVTQSITLEFETMDAA